MHRLTLPALLLLASAMSAGAQTFRLETTPRHAVARPGDRVAYHVEIVPLDGFRATVNVHVLFPTLGRGAIMTTPGSMNYPYSGGVSFSLTPTPAEAGAHVIVVEGWNGSLFVRDTVTLVVNAADELRGWSRYDTLSSEMPSNFVNAIERDRTGAMWAATMRGVIRFDGDDVQRWMSSTGRHGLVAPQPEIQAASSIAIDSVGGVWVGSFRSIARYFDGLWTNYSMELGNLPTIGSYGILDMAVAPDGSVYAVHPGGVLRFDGSEWRPMENAPADAHSITIDHEGGIDVSRNVSLGRFDGRFWSIYMMGEIGAEVYLHDVAIDPSGDRWYLHGRGVLHDDDGVHRRLSNAGMTDHRNQLYTAIDFAADGTYWLATQVTIAHTDGTSWKIYRQANSGLPPGRITDIELAGDSQVWIATYGGGIGVLDIERAASVRSTDNRSAHDIALAAMPNPARDRCTVRFTLDRASAVRATLVDALGRELRHVDAATLGEGTHELLIDVDAVAPGSYFIRLVTNTTTSTVPLSIAPESASRGPHAAHGDPTARCVTHARDYPNKLFHTPEKGDECD